jgi:integral membrane sensor domain MASE1
MNASSTRDRIGYAAGLFGWVALPFLAGSVLSWQTFGAGIGPAFFPPAGVTVAAMLLNRRSLWPVIVAAIVVAELAVEVLVVLVVAHFEQAAFDTERIAEVVAQFVLGDLRRPALEVFAVEQDDPVFLVGVRVGHRGLRSGGGGDER